MRVDARPGLLLLASLLVGGCSLVVDFDRSLLIDGGPGGVGGGGDGGSAGQAGGGGAGGLGGEAGQAGAGGNQG